MQVFFLVNFAKFVRTPFLQKTTRRLLLIITVSIVLVMKGELESETVNYNTKHCVKSVQIWSFFWSVFSRIPTEYGEIRSISPYSVQMREDKDQKKLCIWTFFTQNLSTVRMREIWTRKNSVFGHFSGSENHVPIWANFRALQVKQQVSEAVVPRHQFLKIS